MALERFVPRWSHVLATALSLWIGCAAIAQHQQRPRPGACCITLPAGSLVCIQLTRAECATLGGQFGGEFTSCTAGNVCPSAPTGACCITVGGGGQGQGRPVTTCSILNEVQCGNRGGIFMGNGVTCRAANCQPPPPPTGACCFRGGICTTLTLVDCGRQGGHFQGASTGCASTPCPGAPQGACCVQIAGGQNGGPVNCILTDAVRCSLQGGVYQGDGTTCRTAGCPPVPPPVGACCHQGLCSMLTRRDCQNIGGRYYGDRSTCVTTACPGAPTGACCLQSQGGTVHCRVMDAVSCSIQGGTYRGDGTSCASTTCISPTVRACCVRTASGGFTCVEVHPLACATLSGTFSGPGIPCSSVPCPPACVCDINGDGVVNAADETAFQLLFAAGNADLDMDGDTDLDDWTAFYACYPQGCP